MHLEGIGTARNPEEAYRMALIASRSKDSAAAEKLRERAAEAVPFERRKSIEAAAKGWEPRSPPTPANGRIMPKADRQP